MSYWCVLNVVERWLYGLAEQIIIWYSDGALSDPRQSAASYAVVGMVVAWLSRYSAPPGRHELLREQALAGTHHPHASGDPSTSGYYRWGAHIVKRSDLTLPRSPQLT